MREEDGVVIGLRHRGGVACGVRGHTGTARVGDEQKRGEGKMGEEFLRWKGRREGFVGVRNSELFRREEVSWS